MLSNLIMTTRTYEAQNNMKAARESRSVPLRNTEISQTMSEI
jgi:hypothetical protein